MFEGAKHPLDDGKNHLKTFADSDYAADETRRSTMGSVIMMNGGHISWSSVLAAAFCSLIIRIASWRAIHFASFIFCALQRW